jgi:hypothetical protein
MENATMIAIMMLVAIFWYAGWRMSQEDWSGASISSTTTINERW